MTTKPCPLCGSEVTIDHDARAVPVVLLRSLLVDLESGMMCNPDPGELSQLRELIGDQDHDL